MNASELLVSCGGFKSFLRDEQMGQMDPGQFLKTGLTSREIRRRAARQRSRQFKRHGWVLD